jgi:hypothetical protein
MKAEEFDQKFDDGEDVTGELDLTGIRRPATCGPQQRIYGHRGCPGPDA